VAPTFREKRRGVNTTLRSAERTTWSGRGAAMARRVAVGLLVSVAVLGGTGIAHAASGDISTVPGGGPAAGLSSPHGIAVDSLGNVYVADSGNNRIRMISPAGVATTVAGTGTPGFSGDGGPATSAQLDAPWGVAVDSSGSVFISDSGNHRIRKIDAAGVISTIAGTGAGTFGGDGGLATAAKLFHPIGLQVDNTGAVLVADTYNHRVRKIDAAGVITTIAGTGSAGFTGDGGLATAAKLASPWDVAIDAAGSVFIADYGNCRIRKVTAGTITTVAGGAGCGFAGDGGPATSAKLAYPVAVTVDSSNVIHISEVSIHRIRTFTVGGSIQTAAGTGTAGFSGDGGPAAAAQLSSPWAVAAGPDDAVYIVDTTNNRVRLISGAPITPPAEVPDVPIVVLSSLSAAGVLALTSAATRRRHRVRPLH
jgi:hypothetical protein